MFNSRFVYLRKSGPESGSFEKPKVRPTLDREALNELSFGINAALGAVSDEDIKGKLLSDQPAMFKAAEKE